MSALRKQDAATADADKHVSVPQVSREIDVSRAAVVRLVVAGELEGELVANRLVITKASLAAYKARKGID